MLELLPIFAILVAAPRLSFWDISEHRLPNRITLPLIALSLLSAIASVELGRITNAVSLGLLTFSIGWGLSHLNAIGMGDVKLLTAMALAIGVFSWADFLVALFVGLIVATIFSLVQIVRKQLDKTSSIALGPSLLFGFAIASAQPIAMVLFTVEA